MSIGYKKLRNGVIATLQILGTNNQSRQTISYPDFATYRCSSALVIKLESIYDLSNDYTPSPHTPPPNTPDCSKVNSKVSPIFKGYSICDKHFSYIVGQTIVVQDFDHNLENIKSNGIHYFLSWGQAYYWNLGITNYTGKFTTWYPDGLIESTGSYNNGLKEGLWNSWYTDGIKKSQIYYWMNMYDNLYRFWHPNGNIYIESEYRSGELWGYWKLFSDSGHLLSEFNYIAGLRSGPGFEWYKPSDLLDLNTPQLKAFINYDDNLKDGVYKTWHPNGNKCVKGIYYKNNKIGSWSEFYSNLTLRSKGPYRNGRKVGTWRYYDNNGILLNEKYYSRNEKISHSPNVDLIISRNKTS